MEKRNSTDLADIDWAQDKQPISKQFNDIYFSKEDGCEESRYVFLESNQLEKRFAGLESKQSFSIIETGFGTGLNFLTTWQLWDNTVKARASLEFISIEKFPISEPELSKALAQWSELASYSQQLLNVYTPQPWSSLQRFIFRGHHDSQVRLSIYFCDIERALSQLSAGGKDWPPELRSRASFGESGNRVDVWFLDGFAPSKNPDMWQPSLYEAMAYNSHPHTTFSTFTAAGAVKRGLQAAGFACQKQAGFGKKREMLCGHFQEFPKTDLPDTAPQKTRLASTSFPTWLTQEKKAKRRIRTAIVIGAGLAGSHVAFALAKRGIQVSVLEQGQIASGASSNLQGAVYTRISDSDDPLTEFNKISQIFADQFYARENLYSTCGGKCGVLHVCNSDQERTRLLNFVRRFAADERQYQFLTSSEASDYSGLTLANDALLVKESGWLSPPKVCEALLDHPLISVYQYTQVHNLRVQENTWIVTAYDKTKPTYQSGEAGASIEFEADVCIICNAREALGIQQTSHLPLSMIRGQVSHCVSDKHLKHLRTVLCGEGYVCPAIDNSGMSIHSVGATYNLNDKSSVLRKEDHAKNLATLQRYYLDKTSYFAGAAKLFDKAPGQVGFRTNTPDYFPIVGPIPDLDKTLAAFSNLKNKANALTATFGKNHRGLYCSLGFGSRGLAYSPLAAELIADLISGRSLPLERDLFAHVHPTRFLIRALIKNKPYPTSGSIERTE